MTDTKDMNNEKRAWTPAIEIIEINWNDKETHAVREGDFYACTGTYWQCVEFLNRTGLTHL